jgi:ribosomal protein S18 acetylase RimI-like enzyme
MTAPRRRESVPSDHADLAGRAGPRVSPEIITADTLGLSAMRELFNAGFSGYLMPMHLDEVAFATHLERNDIDLTASPVLLEGDPVAFTLVGFRESDAWIGGMGTVPEARRGGRGRQVMRAALESARGRGCATAWLEVIDANRPALALYEQLGFTTVRDLSVWRLAQSPETAGTVSVELGRAQSWIAANRESAEPWQRADTMIAKLERAGDVLRAVGVEHGGALAGAAIYTLADGSARLLQIAASDEAVAAMLLHSAAGAAPLSLGNLPEGEPASQAIRDLGGELVVRQHEMRLAL